MAALSAPTCVTVFIDETNADFRPRGGASAWWLHHSLAALATRIAARGGKLMLYRGDSRLLVPALAAEFGCGRVTWTRRYGEAERGTDGAIKADLEARGIEAQSFNGNLLYEPMEIKTQAGGPMRAATMSMMLEVLGNEVHTVHDGVAAVAEAEAFQPEIVLMDLGMPRMNGYDATRRIREHTWGRGLTIVALTGWGQEDDRARSGAAGCDAHLVKPLALQDLEHLLASPPRHA